MYNLNRGLVNTHDRTKYVIYYKYYYLLLTFRHVI